MKKLYIIALSPDFDQKKVVEFLDQCPKFSNWFFSMPGTIFAYSDASADSIRSLISNEFPGDKRMFVSEVPEQNFSGRIPKDHCEIIARRGAYVSFDLNFAGYFLESSDIHIDSGVYCVYRCVYSAAINKVDVRELLYTGRINPGIPFEIDRSILDRWNHIHQNDERLCYSVASVPSESLEICEAAIVHLAKPQFNGSVQKETYRFKDTHLKVSGAAKFIPNDGVAYQSQK